VERKSDAAVARLAAAGFKAEPKVLVGDPRIVILREAREWEADCIFLGSRGLDAVERFVLGSVSSAVASHAPCTVEIVRKGPAGKARKAKAG
jgi:nucleotide-binding universal stress UspA family protein